MVHIPSSTLVIGLSFVSDIDSINTLLQQGVIKLKLQQRNGGTSSVQLLLLTNSSCLMYCQQWHCRKWTRFECEMQADSKN